MNAHLKPARPHQERRPRYEREFGDFRCAACGRFVSSLPELSGVHNRNHCPYCLASRHVDLAHPGDRLSACKAIMRPLGLTVKRVHKKYAAPDAGELMLVHHCIDCGKLSLNRIAADDDLQSLLGVFEASVQSAQPVIAGQPITLLTSVHLNLIRKRLLGRN